MDLKFRMITECGIDKIHNVVTRTFQSSIQLNIPSSKRTCKTRTPAPKHTCTHTHTHTYTYIQKPLNGICDSFLTLTFPRSGTRDAINLFNASLKYSLLFTIFLRSGGRLLMIFMTAHYARFGKQERLATGVWRLYLKCPPQSNLPAKALFLNSDLCFKHVKIQ